MLVRPIKLLLLACFAYWASGAALFVHERLEHADGEGGAVIAACSQPTTALDKSTDHKRPHHDHDDCPTCQLLAHMSVNRSAPPPPVCVQLPRIGAISPVDWRAPVAMAMTFAPIRAPPVAMTSAV